MNKRNSALSVLAATLLVCFSLGATAQEEIDETRPLSANATVSVDNISGSIVVTGWDREEIHVTGTLGKGAERLDIDGDKRRLHVEVVLPKGKKNINVKSSHLEILLPYGCRLELEGISADIEVAKVTGRVSAQSVSGDIIVQGEPDELKLETVSGDLELAVTCERVEASTVSGDAELTGCRVQTLGVSNISGKISVEDAIARRVELGTVSGKIAFEGQLTEGGSLECGSQSGDIRVILPAELDAEVELGTFGGTTESYFGPRHKPKKGFGPGEELEFVIGNGDLDIELGTFSGDIRLIRK